MGWLRWSGCFCRAGFRWCGGSGGFSKPWEGGAAVVVFDLDGLLSGCETVVCLVPEGGSIVKSQFFIKNDVPECIDFHFGGGRVPAKLAIVGM